jgi:hypothetical protein
VTTEFVPYTAACPWCSHDATWHTTRNTEGTAQRTRIIGPTCGDSDPAATLAAVITNREGAQA